MEKPGIVAMKRVLAVAAVVLMIALPLAYMGTEQAQEVLAYFADSAQVRSWVDDGGALVRLAFVAAVMAQIVIAVLPGGPLEVAGGYAFGTAEATALCLLGAALGTLAVVTLVRTLGMRVVTLFVSPEKLASLRWLHDTRRLELAMLLLFLIPGAPKDILTYVVALTDCPARRIVAITTLGRTPAVIVSALGADFAAQGDWAAGAVVAVAALVLIVIGASAYARIQRRASAEEC